MLTKNVIAWASSTSKTRGARFTPDGGRKKKPNNYAFIQNTREVVYTVDKDTIPAGIL